MGNLKLALLSYHSCPLGKLGSKDTGGMNVYVLELAGYLGRLGHTVDVFTRRHDADEPGVICPGDMRVIHLNAGPTGNTSKSSLFSYLPEFISNLEDFANKEGTVYDLMFSHYWLSGLAGSVLAKRWQIPHLVMFHTLAGVKNSLGIGENEPELRVTSEKDLIRGFNRIIASTEREKNLLTAEYGIDEHKVTVIPCGVNLDLFKPEGKNVARRALGINPSEKMLLFVGRLEKIKGIDRLIEAIGLMKDIPDIKLYIVGGDKENCDETGGLDELIAEYSLHKTIYFVGSVKQETLTTYYNAADALVLPSYYESFGMVVLEALACGTPVVATDQGNLSNIIRQGETGFVVPNNNPVLLARKLAEVLTGKGLASSEVIRESVMEYRWEKISGLITEACEKELGRGWPCDKCLTSCRD